MELFRKNKPKEEKLEIEEKEEQKQHDIYSYVASVLREYKLIEEEFYIETAKLIRQTQLKQYEEKERQKTK